MNRAFWGSPPMLFTIGAIVSLANGGLTAVALDAVPIQPPQGGSYYVKAPVYYPLYGFTIFGFFAALYALWPKMIGWPIDSKIGRLHFWATFVSFNATFLPMHVFRMFHPFQRIALDDAPYAFWNRFATIGSLALAASALLGVAAMAASLRRPVRTEDPIEPDLGDGRSPHTHDAS